VQSLDPVRQMLVQCEIADASRRFPDGRVSPAQCRLRVNVAGSAALGSLLIA
jgi:hypothetical protein